MAKLPNLADKKPPAALDSRPGIQARHGAFPFLSISFLQVLLLCFKRPQWVSTKFFSAVRSPVIRGAGLFMSEDEGNKLQPERYKCSTPGWAFALSESAE